MNIFRRIAASVLLVAALAVYARPVSIDALHATCGVEAQPANNFERVYVTGVVSSSKEVHRFLPNGRRDKKNKDKIKLGDVRVEAYGLRNSRGLVCVRMGDDEAVWIRGSSVIIDCVVSQDVLPEEPEGPGLTGLGTGSCAR